ncbi:MAG TPA: GTPase HflX, partial [Caulobacteraceae bacterium]|nr:GTPase HflX [Caulobacteraceae bacterium]
MIHPLRAGAAAREPEARLEEAVGLAQALDLRVDQAVIAPMRQITPATLFGRGKTAELGAIAN